MSAGPALGVECALSFPGGARGDFLDILPVLG